MIKNHFYGRKVKNVDMKILDSLKNKRFERKNYRKTLEVNFKKMKRKYT